jgi:hypothetical protein
MTMTFHGTNPIELGPRLVELGAEAGVTARLIGGVAIWLRAPAVRAQPFARAYEDVDLVVSAAGRRRVDDVMGAAGFTADAAFNTMNGRERRCYYGPAGEKVDVFIGGFQMCHTLPLEERLDVDDVTVPLAELFLSKAQIYELNAKDAHDVLALVLDHEVAARDANAINAERVGALCARDWGLWRTTKRSLQTLVAMVGGLAVETERRELIRARLVALEDAIDGAPKSIKWKARNRVGDRVPWYELPEDPDRGPQPVA